MFVNTVCVDFQSAGPRLIEDGFPFEEVSEIAELESWRKEIYRPVYHIHKWWAQRLGSVFRAAILGSAAAADTSLMELFYQPVELKGLTVFDPFMGSGTIPGEAHKLGCSVIGRDINPVAWRAAKVSLGTVNAKQVEELFSKIESTVGERIRRLYWSTDSRGNRCDVLYFFWVKRVACPECSREVDLFSNYVFAKHASPVRCERAWIVCPACGEVQSGRFDQEKTECHECRATFDAQVGPARRVSAVCPFCLHEFAIAETLRQRGQPPTHRLYAKLILRRDGRKEYLRVSDADLAAFEAARKQLRETDLPIPQVRIPQGHNTKQILNYGYRFWHELFNERQLLALGLIASAIRGHPESQARNALALLFSGLLEFNNIFTSYKGEGTGAVRHMFSHHILKPERTPIEANVWGTPKSSGSFSTLYRSRMIRALEYKRAPFEVAREKRNGRVVGRKVMGIAPPMGGKVFEHFPADGLLPGSIYLSCGDSAKTDIPDQTVDLVMTDPPYFDNVHYSELADFFYVWQRFLFRDSELALPDSTRRYGEVQDTEASEFSRKLQEVFAECYRVLRDQGLLVFSYHHSRKDGWAALASALIGAGFSVVQSQPVKSELSLASPKSQAKEPINLDVLLVCKKRTSDSRLSRTVDCAIELATEETRAKIERFNQWNRRLSRNDVQVILISQLMVELCAGRASSQLGEDMQSAFARTPSVVGRLWNEQTCKGRASQQAVSQGRQLSLLGTA